MLVIFIQDGVLCLDAPVNTPDYDSLTFDAGHNLGIKPKESNTLQSATTQVSLKGKHFSIRSLLLYLLVEAVERVRHQNFQIRKSCKKSTVSDDSSCSLYLFFLKHYVITAPWQLLNELMLSISLARLIDISI